MSERTEAQRYLTLDVLGVEPGGQPGESVVVLRTDQGAELRLPLSSSAAAVQPGKDRRHPLTKELAPAMVQALGPRMVSIHFANSPEQGVHATQVVVTQAPERVNELSGIRTALPAAREDRLPPEINRAWRFPDLVCAADPRAPASQIVDSVLGLALSRGATHVELRADSRRLRVRCGEPGDWVDLVETPGFVYPLVVYRLRYLSGHLPRHGRWEALWRWLRRGKPAGGPDLSSDLAQAGEFGFRFDGRPYEVRVAFGPPGAMQTMTVTLTLVPRGRNAAR
jgi:hypothetical protein